MNTSRHERYQAINVDNICSPSFNDSSSLTFFNSVTNSMLDSQFPWARQEFNFAHRRDRQSHASQQLRRLQNEFHINHHETHQGRIEFSRGLALNEQKIESWFEARQLKEQRDRLRPSNNLHVQPDANATNHDSSTITTNNTS